MVCSCCQKNNDSDGSNGTRVQRQTTIQQETTFAEEMERLFSEHGNEGVQLGELESELQETQILDVIPKKKLTKLLRRADTDQNCFITYAEFMTMYHKSEELSKAEKKAMRKFVSAAIVNIVPKFMREDFLRNYTCKPPPVFMIIITAIEIAVFVYYAVQLQEAGHPVTAFTGIPVKSPLMYSPRRRREAWRFLSYMFLHQGYVHLLSNVLFQLLLGLPLEIVHKWWRVLIVFFAGVIGGSLAHSVTDYDVQLAGASGGCYAIIGAHLASIIVNWAEMNYKCSECENPVRIIASAPLRLVVLLCLVAADSCNAVYRRFYDPQAGKIGVSAHIGGLVTGCLIGVSVMKNINIRPWERTVARVMLGVYILAVCFCVLFNGLYKGYPPADMKPCC